MNVVLLTKRDEWSMRAGKIAQLAFPDLLWIAGERDEPMPMFTAPDILLSFLSPWIVPAGILERTKTAINFHPGSANYPGIGCYNFALYEGSSDYGCVAHWMKPAVDTGLILDKERFQIYLGDTVASLRERTLIHMTSLFSRVCDDLEMGRQRWALETRWNCPAYTRKQLEELSTITPDMDADEIARRVRATTYQNFRPRVVLGGHTFECVS